jgi:hypothetical protein
MYTQPLPYWVFSFLFLVAIRTYFEYYTDNEIVYILEHSYSHSFIFRVAMTLSITVTMFAHLKQRDRYINVKEIQSICFSETKT